MSLDKLRNEYCKIKGWRYIEFDNYNDLQDYALWLEQKALSLSDVVGRSEQYCGCDEILVAEFIDKKHCSKCDKPMYKL